MIIPVLLFLSSLVCAVKRPDTTITNSINSFNPHYTVSILARQIGTLVESGKESGYKLSRTSIISLKHTNILDVKVYGFQDTYSPNPRIEIATNDRIITGNLIAARSYRLTSTLIGLPMDGYVNRAYVDLRKENIVEKPSRRVDPHSKEFFEHWYLALSRLVYVPREFYAHTSWD